MSLSAKLRRAPLRIVSGAYILNSGVAKLGADDDTAKTLHGAATGTYPFLGNVQPKMLAKGVGLGEIAVGGALLLPIVPPLVAGAALAGFSGAVLNMYWRTPGMHQEGSLRPTDAGMPLAKDVWMLGMGVGLMADAALEPAHDKVLELETAMSHKRATMTRRARRKAKKAGHTNAEYLRQARESASDLQVQAAKRAQKAAKKARKRAEKASELAAQRLAEMRAEYGPVAAEKARAARDAARHAAEEYGPVAADKARAARDAARQAAEEYGPIAADKARAAAETARQLADAYGTVAVEKAKTAGHAAQEAGAKAKLRLVS
jgi:uncharacterized membrane protein YphA (DoxX/SURF4 family)